jgi:peptidoglycan/LPS O-acetylase OafA/YrhL
MKRIPSLNGLRAISILAVIGGHLAATGGLPLNTRILTILERLPHLGVRVFFVLSGFLITTLILEERSKTGRFSLSKFYARRAWRIIPAAYALLLCLAIANLFHLVDIPWLDYLRSITYTVNYGPVPEWRVGHLWSLSVEEQFYLIWPFLLFFLPVRFCSYIAVGFILVSAVLRYHLAAQTLDDFWRQEYQFQYAGTAMAFGCLLAIDQKWLQARSWFRALCTSPLTAPLTLVAMLANTLLLRTSGAAGQCCADIITNLCIVLLVAKFSFSPVGPGARFLNFKPIAFIGTISYSLYLWQQIFSLPGGQAWIFRFPVNLLLIFLCALSSYYLIEKPSLRIREALRPENANPQQGTNTAPAQPSAGFDH